MNEVEAVFSYTTCVGAARLGTAATEGHKAFVSSVNLAMEELRLAKSWTDPRDPHLISAMIELAQLGQTLRLSPQEICPTARELS
jgi:hypothetical protein